MKRYQLRLMLYWLHPICLLAHYITFIVRNLGNNSFVCNCSVVWIGMFIRHQQITMEFPGNPTCGSPENPTSLRTLNLTECGESYVTNS